MKKNAPKRRPPERLRSEQIGFRVKPHELALIRALVDRRGVDSISALMRELLLDGPTAAVRELSA